MSGVITRPRSVDPPSLDAAPPPKPTDDRFDPKRSPVRLVITAAAVGAWVGVVWLSRWWALRLEADGHGLILFTPPVLGGYRFDGRERFWIPALVAAVLIGVLPRVTRTMRWRAVLLTGA